MGRSWGLDWYLSTPRPTGCSRFSALRSCRVDGEADRVDDREVEWDLIGTCLHPVGRGVVVYRVIR